MSVKSREELIAWSLRALGHPMIQINVTEEQLEDRLDDSLELFQEYNLGGTNRDYIRYRVTEEDIYNQYIPIDGSSVLGIIRLLPVSRLMLGANAQLPFNPMYQMLNTVVGHGWANIDLTSYVMFRQFGETIEHVLNPKHIIRFNRYQNKLFVDWNWGNRDWTPGYIQNESNENVAHEKDDPTDEVTERILFEDELEPQGGDADVYPGDFIILECFKVLDPEEYPLVYNDRWLKEYYKNMVKLQFSENLSKYSGMTLPGGVTLDGPGMKAEAQAEIEKLREELLTSYQEPLTFFVG